VEFTCLFELEDYPFDQQRCPMTLALRAPSADEAGLSLAALEYAGEEKLIEYMVVNVTGADDHACSRRNHSCNRVWLTLKRRVGNQLVNTYLPTSCLLLIIYLTHYFKLEHYDTRIMVSLTGMLVIASLFVSTNANLPNTSYMKMVRGTFDFHSLKASFKIDIWMVFCFFLPFSEVILHTLVEYFGDYTSIKG